MSDFKYTYSAPDQDEIRRIREKYLIQEETSLEQLRRLDAGVTRKATCLALTVGILSCLLFGGGLSLCLVTPDTGMIPGIALGIPGLLGMIFAYPAYLWQTERERRRIAPRILELTESLLR